MTRLYNKCLRIATQAHTGQKRRFTGEDYITHPIAVADTMKYELDKCVAILHDVIEDTKVTVEDLLKEGVPQMVIDDVLLLTRKKGENYYNFISRVRDSASARRVKMADIEHNMSTLEEGHMKDKYRFALDKLKRVKRWT